MPKLLCTNHHNCPIYIPYTSILYIICTSEDVNQYCIHIKYSTSMSNVTIDKEEMSKWLTHSESLQLIE